MHSPPDPTPKSRPRIRSVKRKTQYHHQKVVIRRLVLLCITIGLIGVSIGSIFVWDTLKILPTSMDIQHGHPDGEKRLRFYDQTGQLIYERAQQRVRWIELDQCPSLLSAAFIAAEDHRFFEHSGIDIIGILAAIKDRLMYGGRARGASTLTQQLAKRWVGRERTFKRKWREALLAIRIEFTLTKNEILERYMNQVYLGRGAHGITAAAWTYFRKAPQDLSLSQSALLAGLPPRPSVVNPITQPKEAIHRRNIVLDRMTQLGLIDAKQMHKAKLEVLTFYDRVNPLNRWAPSYIESARSELKASHTQWGSVDLYLNLPQQRIAEEVISKHVNIRPESTEVKGAFISIDRHMGGVESLVSDPQGSGIGFNYVTQSCRSIASTVKPFVYANALKSGMNPDDKISDAPVTIYDPQKERTWTPRDHSSSSGVGVTLSHALAHSLNTPVIHTLKKYGLDQTIQFLRDFNLTQQPRDLTLALGTGCASPLNLSGAYLKLVNNNQDLSPTLIKRKYDTHGELIVDYTHPYDLYASETLLLRSMARIAQKKSPQPILNHRTHQRLMSALRSVVQKGTARAINTLDGQPMGKTGSGPRDLWFVGAIKKSIAGIWLGLTHVTESNPTGSNLTGSNFTGKESASRYALPIWHMIFKRVNAMSEQTSLQDELDSQDNRRLKSATPKHSDINRSNVSSQKKSDIRFDPEKIEGRF